MGKYNKKHEWGACEFVYTNGWHGKKRGDICGARGMKRANGKYHCTQHKEDSIAKVRQLYYPRGIKALARQEARLQARKKVYGIMDNNVAVGTEEEHRPSFFSSLIHAACSIVS